MPIAPLPEPQYISIENVYPTFGENKLAVSLNNSVKTNEVSRNTAMQCIAFGEGQVIQWLSPYYVTVPKIVAFDPNTGLDYDWTWLKENASYTYSILYNAFVYSAGVQLLKNFIAKNNAINGTFESFQVEYERELGRFLNILREKDSNGVYLYKLNGLKTLQNAGIGRNVSTYVATGEMSTGNYLESQLLNPEQNWQNYGYWG